MSRLKRCRWCRQSFAPSPRTRQAYCSPRCKSLNHPGRAKASAIEYGDCPECGGVFVRRAGQAGMHCSIRCSRKPRKRADRARRKNVDHEPYTLRQVAERDGWRCHLCGKRVPPRRYTAKPEDPTVDHLVPLSAGGPDTLTNVALAHNACNYTRSAGGEAQLRLIA